MTIDEMPNVTCPVCYRNFHQDDYYDCAEGADLECPDCGAALVIAEIETRTFWRVDTLHDYLVAEAQNDAARKKARASSLAVIRRADKEGKR